MEYTIEPVHGHYEIYINGKFYCTADSTTEAKKEIEAHKAEHCLAEA